MYIFIYMYIHIHIYVYTVICISLSLSVANKCTGWRKPIGYLKLQVIFRKITTNYMALLLKIIYEDTASYGSLPPCIVKCVCCSVLQCVAVCCSVLQCVARNACALSFFVPLSSVLQCVAVCCSVLQYVAVCKVCVAVLSFFVPLSSVCFVGRFSLSLSHYERHELVDCPLFTIAR